MLRRTGRCRVVVGVVTGLLAASCGSSSGSSAGDAGASTSTKTTSASKPASSIQNLCTVITADDAAKVFGGRGTVQPPSGTEAGVSGACIYKQDGTGATVNLLQVRVYPGPQYYGADVFRGSKSIKVVGAQKAFERVRTSGAGATTIDLQFVKDGKTGAINYVATGGTIPEASTTALLDIANQLARNT